MERDELLGSIARAAERLQRAQTDFDKEKWQTRLDELRAQLRKMDDPPPKVEDPRAPGYFALWREMLGGKKNG